MRSSNPVICVLLAVATLTSFASAADDTLATKKCKCPVAGTEFTVGDAAASTQYKDAKVYFCCPGCMKRFVADQKKYAAKANLQLFVTGQAKQVHCPFAGRDANPDQSVTVDNHKVAFCCGGCKGKAAAAEGDAQLEMLFGEKAFKTGFEVVKK
ncbi:YHS domain-containing protein [Rosistilla oblonga]|uniref:YHS domain protein n=1 Tax=Rosistilla oblonga TaxID=2527990 RepID=A0A518IWH9_9BACT|nr:YHS domain-containing protein [Rosistilla oblonga]QDV57437.1 YHS domain protein [Rosistilla oblonga]